MQLRDNLDCAILAFHRSLVTLPSRYGSRVRQLSVEHLRQLGDVSCDPPRLVFGESDCGGPCAPHVDKREVQAVRIRNSEVVATGLADGPGRWKAARLGREGDRTMGRAPVRLEPDIKT